jgi:hypothetical protein
MKYDEDCPVFEVVNGGFDGGYKDGSHHVCFPWLEGLGYPDHADTTFPIRAEDGSYAGFPFRVEEIRPLTRAAREMLALVTR